MCGKGVQQTSQQVAYPSLPAAAAYSSAMDRIAQATSQPFQRYSSDPEAYVASLTPTQRGAISSVSGLRGMTDPYYQGATGLTLAGAGPVGRLTGQQISEYMSPYMSQVIDPVRAALQQQQGQQLSQQQAEAIKSGAFGGSRSDVARALLRGQQELGMGQALSPLYQTGYGQALQTAQGQQAVEAANLQRLLGAGQQLGGLGSAAQQAALQQASAQLQAGTLEQQTSTAQKQALYNEFQKQRMYPLQVAQLYAQTAAGLGPLMGSTSQGYQAMPFFGGFAADGGAIKGYDKGLGRARMGGAVDEPGDYARGGYADGGDAGFGDIVAQQRAALGLGQAQPDVQFPTTDIRPGQQLRADLPQGQQSGGLGSMLTKGAEAAKKGFDIREKLGKLPSDASFLDKASAFFADGGSVDEDAMSDLLSRPIQASKPQQPQQAPEKQKSGLGGLLKAGAGLAANAFLPGSGPLVSAGLGALGMADGGRAGYADGGPGYDPELDYMARTMIKEAGDQGDTGMAAVGHVGMNRLLSGRYGKTLQDVFTAPKQFSPWNQGARGTRADPRLIDPASRSYQHAYDLARRVREGEIEDPTGGATHFYAQKLVNPKWAQGVDPTAVIGGHTFLRADAGADRRALGSAAGNIPKGDPRRSFEASYKDRMAAPARKDPGFVENVTEHPERLIVPILQGLGAMAGSKSRYAGSAILEGLGAGAGSYLETGKALEEQRKMHEEADLLRASGLEAGASALKTLREMPIWVNPANPGQSLVMTSSGAVMDLNAYLTMTNPPPLMGAQEASLAAQQLGLREKGATQAGYAPEGGIMPTGLNAVRQAGAEGEEPAVETARDVVGESNGVPQKQITPTPKPMTYVGINLGEAAASAPAQERSYINSLGGKAAFETSQDIRRNINQQGAAARAQSMYNGQVAQIISEAANAGGFEAMGAGSEARARIVNTLNTLARGAGLGDSYFGANESRQQMLDKINAIRGEATVQGAGQPAYSALETVIASMPGTGQTQRAGTFNAASNLVQNQKRIDYQNYANAYGQRSGNLYNNVEDAFSSDNSNDKYQREEDAFQKIIRSPNGSKLLEHFMKGEKPDGSKASKADIDAFFKNKFDLDGMSRYFMGARGG